MDANELQRTIQAGRAHKAAHPEPHVPDHIETLSNGMRMWVSMDNGYLAFYVIAADEGSE